MLEAIRWVENTGPQDRPLVYPCRSSRLSREKDLLTALSGKCVMRLPQSERHQEASQRGRTFISVWNLPFKMRRASQERAPIIRSGAKCCLSAASCAERALSEKHRAARRAASYGRFLLVTFLFTRKKSNKMVHNNRLLHVLLEL